MKFKRTITILVFAMVVLAALTTLTGILSKGGPGEFDYKSIRGQTVTIYGKGIYQHMSADVAIQGIAQDVVTLFIGIPLLLISLARARKGSLKSRLLLAGTSGYFLVTFLFYTAMAMYNILFLAYVSLLALSFFTFILTALSFDIDRLPAAFSRRTPVKFVAGFLLFNTAAIGLLWLSVIVPPLLGAIYPEAVQHYTTLIVQGFDLGLLLPAACVSAILFLKKRPLGYLLAPTYVIFLAILMTALTAKIIAMALNGVNVMPAVFIVPAINLVAILCSFLLLKNLQDFENQ
ncbi:hypothetical protein JXA02_03970 [candidate division KSB1 bacterium]|nr:hypothetical protein [candidate division KSB1 bacterium]RQW09120.1 MAG: hypothetical protein EH222_04455 [candidate division KSB1 bacterium]